MASPDTFTCHFCEHSTPSDWWEPVEDTDMTEAYCPECDMDHSIGSCDACNSVDALIHRDHGSFCFGCTGGTK